MKDEIYAILDISLLKESSYLSMLFDAYIYVLNF